MIETKELTKIYRPKKGVPVTALDKISLRFPDKGMVFLLGKSGSGKSTLLNLLGGLDKYDGGEIIIKGVSSKDFKQSHFDSYRNTYVGFIFQEYNVLDEFTVGANIALAIELQGRKARDGEINDILKRVDLEGFGQRKPGELSGGQKQRVAIARALVKNPDIIMADEPTGALDSGTGRQVLETLKKLSETKLVIVVSHDREFAERYADRIIELSDGKVIRDVERNPDPLPQSKSAEPDGLVFEPDGACVKVPAGYRLSEEDRLAINRYIENLEGGAVIQADVSETEGDFVPTDEGRIPERDKKDFKLIKSKLPIKSAFRIGASGLKHKKIRLAVTIVLSCIAFTLFGMADTFGSYDHIKTCTNSIVDTGIRHASVVKSVRRSSGSGEWWDNGRFYISDSEIAELTDKMGTKMTGLYSNPDMDTSLERYMDPQATLTETEYNPYVTCLSGFAEVSSSSLADSGCSLLAGNLPDGSENEIALSSLVFEAFRITGFYNGTGYDKIKSYGDLVGRSISLGDTEYRITGIVDTGYDLDRYAPLAKATVGQSKAQQLIRYALANECSYAAHYSLADAAMVGSGFVKRMSDKALRSAYITEKWVYINEIGAGVNETLMIDPQRMTSLADIKTLDASAITWFNGEKTSLSDGEILVSSDLVSIAAGQIDGFADEDQVLERIASANFEMSKYELYTSEEAKTSDVKVVGFFDSEKVGSSSTIAVSDSLLSECTLGTDGLYAYAVGAMPTERADVEKLVSYCYSDGSGQRYELMNSVSFELDTVDSVLKALATVFFWTGVGFALFAALMLANFIGTSISYKKQEIGILRAIGSRSADVFRIFFSESFIIAAVNFLLSFAGTLTATAVVNSVLREHYGILITVLSFGLRQTGLLLVISIAVAAVASYVPVYRIASKRPIDAIRNR